MSILKQVKNNSLLKNYEDSTNNINSWEEKVLAVFPFSESFNGLHLQLAFEGMFIKN